MPLVQKTVYFRKEDIPKWEAIKNKAEWLHDALSATAIRKDNKYPAKAFDIKQNSLTTEPTTYTKPIDAA